jgi:hypothetical protein
VSYTSITTTTATTVMIATYSVFRLIHHHLSDELQDIWREIKGKCIDIGPGATLRSGLTD